ncbi:hypothetical protein DPMN_176974 [Dreissena polymorpha]|uniref:Uncharacterized protein n=1 Tax=Dreissena polymorpha TaxID=45954 RepID=A0A9D4E7W9_DREPO|nr:hypothetical protein DPMN_176974 [Dreissena polymorpha]
MAHKPPGADSTDSSHPRGDNQLEVTPRSPLDDMWAISVPHLRYQDIIGTNLLTELLTRKNAPPPGSHVFQPTGIIFEHFQNIIGMNLLTKFHEDRTVNVASRVLTRFYYSRIRNKSCLHRKKYAPKKRFFET